jgi:O-antigen ligase
VLLTGRRLQAVLAGVLATAASGLGLLVIHARPTLTEGPLSGSLASSQGHSAFLLILLACAALALVWGLGSRFVPRDIALPRPLRIATWVGVVVVAIGGIIAIDPGKRLDAFKVAPGQGPGYGHNFVESHLASTSGSGRWQFWSGAVDEFHSAPVIGHGAGSFEAFWAQHGSLDYFIRNAHSLWLETLGDLGIIGLVLLVGAFVTALAVGARRLRGQGRDDRAAIAALVGVVLAFALGAALDWVWQFAAIGGLAVVCLGLLAGPASEAPGAERARRPRLPLGARLATAVACLALLGFAALPLLGGDQLTSSRAVAATGNTNTAVSDALNARALEPWSSEPLTQLALVEEQAGHLQAARKWIGLATARNGDDWRLWLIAARIEVKQGDVGAAKASVARLQNLNPHAPIPGLS